MRYKFKHNCSDLIAVDVDDNKDFAIISFALAGPNGESTPEHIAVALPMRELCGLRDFLAQLPLERSGGLN